jgi:excisionase family DNA binding protein
MATEHDGSDQLELWPLEPTEAAGTDAREVRGCERIPPCGQVGPRPRLSRRQLDTASAPAPEATPGTADNDDLHLWSIGQVADFLGVSKDTIYGWRKTGYGPPASKIGKHLRWRRVDVATWVDRHRELEPHVGE